MSFSWSGPAVKDLSAAAMAALLLASAGKHFRDPGFYRDVVPTWLCRQDDGEGEGGSTAANHPLAILSREEWIAVSGLLELAAAVGILIRPTRKLTVTALSAMFTAFLAGHVDALVKAYGAQGTARRRKIHTVRLPLQAPLIVWAWSLRKPVRPRTVPGGRA
ncbi:MAG: hypothetical protein ACLGH7_01705 [Actinomycetes bacterium]